MTDRYEVAWMTPSDWRDEPLATCDKSVASAWRADNRQVTPLYATHPVTLTDDLLVQLFYAAQGDIIQFRIKARALLEAK